MLSKNKWYKQQQYIKQQKQIYGLRKSRQELANKIDDFEKVTRQIITKPYDRNKSFEGGC